VHELRDDGFKALRGDGHLAVRAVLGAEFDVEQAQEGVDFGQGGDGAFVAATTGSLFDGDGGGDAGETVDFGAAGGLDELAGVGVE
jgi:hypothetical protein